MSPIKTFDWCPVVGCDAIQLPVSPRERGVPVGKEELDEVRATVRREVFSLEACSRCWVVTDHRSLKMLSRDSFICEPCLRDQELVAEELQWAGGAD
jgi:hypothetical protein